MELLKTKLKAIKNSQQQLEKDQDKKYKELVKFIKAKCKKEGLSLIEFQLKWLKSNTTAEMLRPELGYKLNIEAWDEGIHLYKLSLINKK